MDLSIDHNFLLKQLKYSDTIQRRPQVFRASLISIYKRDYPQIENDSYILPYQIRAVSKNRITKKGIVGSLSNTQIMAEIEEYLYCKHTPYLRKLHNERIESLEKQNEILIQRISKLEEKLGISNS